MWFERKGVTLIDSVREYVEITDKGIVILIGERFADEQFNNILPEYWFKQQGDIEITNNYVPVIQKFWDTINEKS